MISFIASPGSSSSSSSIGIGSSLIDAQHGHRNAKSLSELSRRRSKYGTTRKRAPVQRRLQQIVAQNLNCSPSRPSKLAVLVSGGGRSLDNICERLEAGTLSGCEVSVVIASAATAGAIQRAEKYAIPTRVVSMKAFERQTQPFSDAVTRVLDEFGVDLVVLAGWMHFYCIPPRYYGKVINIHPSLIPAFCGKGYYGQRVHEAVVRISAPRRCAPICCELWNANTLG